MADNATSPSNDPADEGLIADSTLWNQARETFEAETRQETPSRLHGRESYLNALAEFLSTRGTVISARDQCRALESKAGSQYSEGYVTIGGRKIFPKRYLGYVVQNLDYFVQAGDYLVKGAPETVGLVWMAVKVLVGAIQSDYGIVSNFMVALHDLTSILVRCRAKVITFSPVLANASEIEDQMFKRIPEIYAKILSFSFSVQRYLRRHNLGRLLSFQYDFTSSIEEIHKLEREVTRDTRDVANQLIMSFQDRTSATMDRQTATLADLLESQLESSIVLTAMQEDVSESRSIVVQISDTVEQSAADVAALKEAEDQSRSLDKVEEWLAIGQSMSWSERQREIFDGRTPNTGEWLLNSPIFRTWTKPDGVDGDFRSILLLEGREGSGKSYLVSLANNFLLIQQAQDKRIHAAYYYINRSAPGTSVLNNALQAYLWQLAASEARFSHDISGLCHREAELGGLAGVFKRFLMDSSTSSDARFYFILDGCDTECSEAVDFLTKVTESVAAQKRQDKSVRMFFSGRLNVFKELRTKSADLLQDLTDVPFTNTADTHLYAEESLGGSEIFQVNSEERSTLRQRISDTLSQAVDGDFFALQSKLNEIKSCSTVEAIDQVLARAGEGRLAAVERDIEELNASLLRFEIREINSIVRWLVDAFTPLSVSQYSAILSARGSAHSLMPLDVQMRGRYFAIFAVDNNGTVTLRSETISQFLKSASHQARSADLQPSEISMVEHMLKANFNNVFGTEKGHEIYRRFGFERFFHSQLSVKTDRIQLMSQSANDLEIAIICLEVISDTTSNLQVMEDYAYEWFAAHLQRCDRARSDLVGRQKVVKLLLKSLRDPETAAKWWSGHRGIRRLDLLSPKRLRLFTEWLTDPTVQSTSLEIASDLQWVASRLSDPSSNIWALMEEVVTQVAVRWVRMDGEFEAEEDWKAAYQWIYIYRLKSSKPGAVFDSEKITISNHDFRFKTTLSAELEDIREVHEWAQARLKTSFEDDAWHYCLGKTLAWHDTNVMRGEARTALESVSLDFPEYWRVRLHLATILLRLSVGQKTLEGDVSTLLDPIRTDISTLLEASPKFGNAYWLKSFETIREFFVFKVRPQDAEPVLRAEMKHMKFDKPDVLAKWGRSVSATYWDSLYVQHKFDRLVDYIEELAGSHSSGGLYLLDHLVSDLTYQRQIMTAARLTGRLDDLAASYRTLIVVNELAANWKLQHDKWFQRNLNLGLVLWISGGENRQTALDVWENAARSPPYPYPDSDYENSQYRRAAELLIPAYTARASDLAQSSALSLSLSSCLQYTERIINHPSVAHDPNRLRRTRTAFQVARIRTLVEGKKSAQKLLSECVRQRLTCAMESKDPPSDAMERAKMDHDRHWLDLLRSLFIVGDDTNGTALLHRRLLYLHRPKEFAEIASTLDKEEGTQNGIQHKTLPSNRRHYCEICTRLPENGYLRGHELDGSWLCIDCSGPILCNACYNKLQSDTLQTDGVICDKNHQFLLLPRKHDVDGKIVSSWSNETIWVADEEVPLTDWYRRIEQDWTVAFRGD